MKLAAIRSEKSLEPRPIPEAEDGQAKPPDQTNSLEPQPQKQGEGDAEKIQFYNDHQLNLQVENFKDQDGIDKAQQIKPDRPRKRRIRRHPKDPMLVKQFREFKLASGVVFKGLSTKREPLTGDGQLIFTDGSLYVGRIRKGAPHGQGEKTWKLSGPLMVETQETLQSDAKLNSFAFRKSYKGNWVAGKMEGFGELTLQEDEVFIEVA